MFIIFMVTVSPVSTSDYYTLSTLNHYIVEHHTCQISIHIWAWAESLYDLILLNWADFFIRLFNIIILVFRVSNDSENFDRNQEGLPFLVFLSLSSRLFDSNKYMWIDSNQVCNSIQVGWNNPKRIEVSQITLSTYALFTIFEEGLRFILIIKPIYLPMVWKFGAQEFPKSCQFFGASKILKLFFFWSCWGLFLNS